MDPEKIQAVKENPVPTNLKAGWFVPNFSQVAEPLMISNGRGANFSGPKSVRLPSKPLRSVWFPHPSWGIQTLTSSL